MLNDFATIRITAPGTPQRVTQGEPNPSEHNGCHGVMIQVLPDNVGRVYVGKEGMNKTAFTKVLAFLAVPTKNSIPSFQAALTLAPGAIQLRDLWIDADSVNDGVIVSVLIA